VNALLFGLSRLPNSEQFIVMSQNLIKDRLLFVKGIDDVQQKLEQSYAVLY
jgi:hypothetical protein